MSGRSTRRRSKSARALEAEAAAEAEKQQVKSSRNNRGASKTPSTPKVQKPKYLTESNGETSTTTGRSATPASSKSSSRATSPASSAAAAPSRSSARSKRSVPAAASSSRRSAPASGANTPASRASRSSSIASNGPSRQKSKSKSKSKSSGSSGGRGYNPSAVNYKESEYHYGSDFEDEYDDDEGAAHGDDDESGKSDSSSDLDDSRESDDELEVESDVDLDVVLSSSDSLPETPVPFWLRTDEEIPDLKLPPSSQDLLVPNEHLLQVVSMYEILRRFQTILRLSPFRLEDFCAALSSEDQSNLLSEVHLSLLKTLIRSEESQSTTFGAMDQKDSVNAVIFFADSFTWPEALRSFMQAEAELYAEPLDLMTSLAPEYPMAPSEKLVESRVKILSFLVDQVLLTPALRDYIAEDGHQATEEHCRVCHRLGEMLVCDTCPGVYHLGCLDPPMHDVPEEEWRCYVCVANDVEGVNECPAQPVGKKGQGSCRQEALGFDRKGNKYWFIARRLIIEMAEGEETVYYSTVRQLEELSEVLDDEVYEKELWNNMELCRVEMERQMDTSEDLTNSKKAASRKSYFEQDNAIIEQIQKDREAEEAKKNAGNSDQNEKKEEEPPTESGVNSTDANGSVSEGKGEAESAEEDKSDEVEDRRKAAAAVAAATSSVLLPKDASGEVRMTRRTTNELSAGTFFFKLGQEGTYKTYVNQFVSNPNALAKSQANEERIKKQSMSHKFSLTDVSAFKWNGALHGSRVLLAATLRSTILQLEANIPTLFMHPNWTLLRKPWIGAVSSSNTPKDFARALTVLQCCMKPSIMLPVWSDMLGHTVMKKLTAQMKDDKKKTEKRERKEKEEEEERLRPLMAFVKYTLGLKHSVSKQKGEEYRAHGQFGWLWLSATRAFVPTDAAKQGLRAGPHRMAVKYADIRDGTFKIVLMEPKAFNYLVSKQDEMDKEKEVKKEEAEEGAGAEMEVDGAGDSSGDSKGAPSKMEVDIKDEDAVKDEVGGDENKENNEQSGKPAAEEVPGTDPSPSNGKAQDVKQTAEKKRLEEALKNARLERQKITSEMLAGAIDVCSALSNPTRALFPKVAKKAKHIDDFLGRRLQLKSLEERRIDIRMGNKSEESGSKSNSAPDQLAVKKDEVSEVVDVEGDSDTKTSVTSSLTTNAKEGTDPMAPSGSDDRKEKVNAFCTQAKKAIWAMVSRVKDMNKGMQPKRPDGLSCYSACCRQGLSSSSACYSVTCRNYPNNHPALSDASSLYLKLASNAKDLGLDVKSALNTGDNFLNRETAITELQNLVGILVKKKAEFDESWAMGMATVSAGGENENKEKNTDDGKIKEEKDEAAVNVGEDVIIQKSEANEKSSAEDEKKTDSKPFKRVEKASDGSEIIRVYSSDDTTGKLYLKRIQSVAESKKQSKVVKYPLAPHFYAKTRKKRNLLLLAKHDVKRMARRAGTVTAEGFNYNAKSNNIVWPYPCPRPLFKTTWLYKTASVESVQSVALQMRVLWASVRWDDMAARPLSVDGKYQTTTETAITTTEIMKHRNAGRFMERAQYFQRKVTIPLDVPKREVEVAPIRSGLRKRKRAESPQQAEPKVVEDWVDEEKLELWEIRAYREKMDRDKNASVTRTRSGVGIREPDRLDPGAAAAAQRRASVGGDVKVKMEQQFQNQKVPCYQPQSTPAGPVAIATGPNAPPTILRRVTNADGTVSLVRTTTTTLAGGTGVRPIAPSAVGRPSMPMIHPATKKLFISKDGKVIGAQVLPQSTTTPQPKVTLPTAPVQPAPVIAPMAAPSSAANQPQQKVQIVRSSDGKIQVRGLLPGQQLVQMPDGKLQIFTNPNASPVTSAPGSAAKPVVTPGTLASPIKVASPPGATVLPSTPKPPTIATTAPASSSPQQKQVVAQQLAPGTPIPPGHTAFVSGGKTYTIPKSVTAGATGIQIQKLATPAAPAPAPPTAAPPAPPVPLVSSPMATNAAAPAPAGGAAPGTPGGKQVMEVKPLGQNSVTFKGTQMIVSGPDMAQAQAIAKQLSSGQARLASYNGKQVLISTTTAQPAPGTPTVSPALATPSGTPTMVPALPTQPLPQSVVKNTPATPEPPKPPVQVTAQLLQTAQGPRIVLQGIQGSNLPKEDLATIQQQVKNQLLKAQAEAKQQNKVPPTKIVIDLPPAIQAKLQATEKSDGPAPPQISSPPSIPPTPPSIQLPTTPVAKPLVMQQQGPKMVVMNQQGTTRVIGVSQAGQPMIPQPQTPAQQQASLLLQSLTPQKPEAALNATADKDGKFEVTPEYIQSTINSALKNTNLSPEIEQKLLAMKQANSNAGDGDGGRGPRGKKVDPGDEEWAPGREAGIETGTRFSGRKKRPTLAAAMAAAENDDEEDDTAEESRSSSQTPEVPATWDEARPAAKEKSSPDVKKQLQLKAKMDSMLRKHKDQLKKEIAKKRQMQEREIKQEIGREVESIKRAAAEEAEDERMAEPVVDSAPVFSAANAAAAIDTNDTTTTPVSTRPKRKRSEVESGGGGARENHTTPAAAGVNSVQQNSSAPPPAKKKKRNSSSSAANNAASSAAVKAGIVKKDKLYCVCKTKYDPSKFYVGCDVCNDWFHGSCVGITEEMSRSLSEFICDGCKPGSSELYCICKTPYDESQFYIGCERCSDWFHGRCVGILQSEADQIDEYVCPRCDPDSKLNRINSKPLSKADKELIKKVAKQLAANRNSWPFKQPVDPADVPNYYKVVKEPMDLQTVENRVSSGHYGKLVEFVGDVMRIFENCRYFNQPNTQIMKCAEGLETFFAQKLGLLREKLETCERVNE